MSVATPSRRGLLTATAWSVPAVMVASAAPAFAASGPAECAEAAYRAAWSGGTWNFDAQTSTGTLLAAPTSALSPGASQSAQPLIITATTSFAGTMVGATASDGAGNMRISPFNVGTLGHRGLTMMQRLSDGVPPTSNRRANAQTLVLNFNRPVRGLQFVITDIDSATDQYRDRVELSGAPQVQRATGLAGVGSAQDPLRNTSNSASYDPATDGRGNATVSYADPVQEVRVTFWNDHPRLTSRGQVVPLQSNGLQGIFLSNLTFVAATC